MRIRYISPSVIPSKSANSVHVINQCVALCQSGHEVTLHSLRPSYRPDDLNSDIIKRYGISHLNLKVLSVYNPLPFGGNLLLAISAILHVLFQSEAEGIVSRNLYAAFLISIFSNQRVVYETHQLEFGWKKLLQRSISARSHVRTIFVSRGLRDDFQTYHALKLSHATVLHDAARDGISVVPLNLRRPLLSKEIGIRTNQWSNTVGYFGSLNQGRGINIIFELATAKKDTLFLVCGHQVEKDVSEHLKSLENILYLGHLPHQRALTIMRLLDVLLLPYQRDVSIGAGAASTVRWMSPMKMFEYLASGVPVIASRLSVLEEVLEHRRNCLLANPADVNEWLNHLNELRDNPRLAVQLGSSAHDDYRRCYTWSKRASIIVQLLG